MRRVALCPTDAVTEGEATSVVIEAHRYAVAHSGGQWYVLDDTCPHAGASLGDEGYVDGTVIECGWHEARFDLRTGAVVGGPCERPTRVYAAQVIDGMVWIDV